MHVLFLSSLDSFDKASFRGQFVLGSWNFAGLSHCDHSTQTATIMQELEGIIDLV